MNKRMLVVAVALAAVAAAPPRAAEPVPGIVARSLGPAVMGGRVTSVAVVETDPATQYVGAASGGLWKTIDEGKSWACVFAGRPHPSIGAVAVAPSRPAVVWLGTGEANARNSVSWGNGVYVSRDGGKTWTHVGLTETHHIGRIAVHPRHADVAYVAAVGHLWGPNDQRGLFGTRDGGRTWNHLLKLDADTGCVDVVVDPAAPDTVYAAAYRVRRDGFSGGNPAVQFGPLAGIYRSDDAGRSWKRLTRGLPRSDLGRVGLTLWRRDPRVVYAVVPTERTDIRNVSGQPVGWGGVEAGGVFVSRDRGETWEKVNDLCPRPFYFGKLRVDPTNDQRVWVLGIPLSLSGDGGRTFRSDAARGVHYDHHDLWINPADPRHLVLGNDGGLYHSRDGGQTWTHVNNLPISQFYAVAVDRRTPYRVYGGLQDNGTWGGPSRTANPLGILNDDWSRHLGMDGFHCQVATEDNNTLYAEGQYGQLHRIDLALRQAVLIRPRFDRPNPPPLRFNWSSPVVASAHEGRAVYYGGNLVFKSLDRGNTWRQVSPDLTLGDAANYDHKGHTLTALAESPLRAGVLYAGSDDGRVHVTRDDGRTWVDRSAALPGVPAARTITRIACSPHAEGTAWLSLSRHRQDDRRPYVFRTDDHGATWRAVAGNLPEEGPVHVVRQDERNAAVVYVGTEFGLYVSLDGGGAWQRLGERLPPVAVHDVVVQPAARELVVGTHGRGLYVIDVGPLGELTAAVREKRAHLFSVREAMLPKAKVSEKPAGTTYQGENPPDGAVIHYRMRDAGPAVVEVVGANGREVARLKAPSGRGLLRVVWDLRDRDGRVVPAGEYTVRLRVGGEVVEAALRIASWP